MLIRRDDIPEVVEPRNSVVMRSLVRAAENGPDLSLTWVRLAGRHQRLRTGRSTRAYYVLDGAATFVVGDGEPFEARGDDVVVISRGTPYEFWGEMDYLVVNGPAFVEGDDVYD